MGCHQAMPAVLQRYPQNTANKRNALLPALQAAADGTAQQPINHRQAGIYPCCQGAAAARTAAEGEIMCGALCGHAVSQV